MRAGRARGGRSSGVQGVDRAVALDRVVAEAAEDHVVRAAAGDVVAAGAALIRGLRVIDDLDHEVAPPGRRPRVCLLDAGGEDGARLLPVLARAVELTAQHRAEVHQHLEPEVLEEVQMLAAVEDGLVADEEVARAAAVELVVARAAEDDILAALAVDDVVVADRAVDREQDRGPTVFAVGLVEVAAVADHGDGRCFELGQQALVALIVGVDRPEVRRVDVEHAAAVAEDDVVALAAANRVGTLAAEDHERERRWRRIDDIGVRVRPELVVWALSVQDEEAVGLDAGGGQVDGDRVVAEAGVERRRRAEPVAGRRCSRPVVCSVDGEAVVAVAGPHRDAVGEVAGHGGGLVVDRLRREPADLDLAVRQPVQPPRTVGELDGRIAGDGGLVADEQEVPPRARVEIEVAADEVEVALEESVVNLGAEIFVRQLGDVEAVVAVVGEDVRDGGGALQR